MMCEARFLEDLTPEARLPLTCVLGTSIHPSECLCVGTGTKRPVRRGRAPQEQTPCYTDA